MSTQSHPQLYTDDDFLEPLDTDEWTSLLIVADSVGCSIPTAQRRCEKLAEDRRVAFENPPGTTAVAQRRVRIVDDD